MVRAMMSIVALSNTSSRSYGHCGTSYCLQEATIGWLTCITEQAVGQICSTASLSHNLAQCQVLVRRAVAAGAKVGGFTTRFFTASSTCWRLSLSGYPFPKSLTNTAASWLPRHSSSQKHPTTSPPPPRKQSRSSSR